MSIFYDVVIDTEATRAGAPNCLRVQVNKRLVDKQKFIDDLER